MNLKRLQQVTIEDKYSRHDRRAIIMRDMQEGLSQSLENATSRLVKYFDTTYPYNSKNTRIAYYKENTKLTNEELIMEILLITLPLQIPKSIQSVVGKLAEEMGYSDIFSGIITASEVIAVVSYTGLYTIIQARNSETGSIMIQSNYRLEEASIERLENMKYLPPMICQPDKVWSNNHSGYLTKDDSVILGVGNHHDNKLNLYAINQAASVCLALDEKILQLEEKAKKPDPSDTAQQLADKAENHKRMVKSSKVVYAEILESGNKFWFNWQFDKRGRMYCNGYHISIQSTSYKKAMLNLATPQIILGV